MTISPQSIDGTWDEISRFASRYGGRRLRLTLLPNDAPSCPDAAVESRSRYAARLHATLAACSGEEDDAAEGLREMNEMMAALNANRLKDGAEPVF